MFNKTVSIILILAITLYPCPILAQTSSKPADTGSSNNETQTNKEGSIIPDENNPRPTHVPGQIIVHLKALDSNVARVADDGFNTSDYSSTSALDDLMHHCRIKKVRPVFSNLRAIEEGVNISDQEEKEKQKGKEEISRKTINVR